MSMSANRIPAWAYWMERKYGRKVPVCPRCGGEDLTENFARASHRCHECGWEIAGNMLRWVPADPRARTLSELQPRRTA